MKSDIEYFYNLKIAKLNSNSHYYFFEYNYSTYYFTSFTRPIEDLTDLIRVSEELRNRNINCHEFIYNKDGKIVTVIDDVKYIMLKINVDINTEIDLIDIYKMQNSLTLNAEKSKLYRNNWGELWSEKIDYFEYQIHEIGKDKELILNSFSYYVGLAENAISYVNNTNENYPKNFTLTLSHKRIFYPNTALNYYNPLSYIFDLRVRDIAEYLKSAFFHKENVMFEFTNYLENNKLTDYEYRMLYARLLYPSYYFDLYQQIMDDNLEEDSLVEIISLVNEYEIFLKEAYILISKYALIEQVDWLMKKDVSTL